MALVTKQDLIDSKSIRLSVNTEDRVIDPHIETVFEFTPYKYVPTDLAIALRDIHVKTDPLTTAEQTLKSYFDSHLKNYYLMEVFLSYIEAGSEALLTASGHRTFKELQSDKVSADVYAQILNKYERFRDAAGNRLVTKLITDKYLIGDVTYNAGVQVTVPVRRKQRHFNVILPYNPFD